MQHNDLPMTHMLRPRSQRITAHTRLHAHLDVHVIMIHSRGATRTNKRGCVQGQRAYEKLRVERMNAKREGMRQKRKADAEAEDK